MGQITGNDKDFPTIKQVNDALGDIDGGGTLDISIKAEEFRGFFGITMDNYMVCNNVNLRNMMDTLRTGKYNRLIADVGWDIPIQIINKDTIAPICIFNWYTKVEKILTTVLRLKTYEFKTVEFDKSGDNSKIEALEFYRKEYSSVNINASSTIMPGFVVFNTITNTFIQETIHTGKQEYFGGWINQEYFGTVTIKGVKPIENKIYKETSTGKFYICKSGTLIELNDE